MFKLAYRYIKSNRKSSIRAIIGIAFSIMLMFSLVQMSGYIMDSFQGLVTTGMHRDFTVYNLSCEELKAVNERLADEPLSERQKMMSLIWVGDVYTDGVDVYKVLGASGDIGYFKSASIHSGEFPVGEGDICVEKSYADSNGVKVGDQITLDIMFANEMADMSAEIPYIFNVSCIINDLVDDGTYFLLSLDGAERVINDSGIPSDPRSNSIAYEHTEGKYDVDAVADAKIAIKNLVTEISPEKEKTFFADCMIDNEFKSESYNEEGTFTSVSFCVLAISFIIAVCMIIFIYNTLSISFMQKLDNLATMRCIGMNNRQVGKMVLAEALLLMDVSYIIGCISGNILNMFVAKKLVGSLIQDGVNDGIGLSQSPFIYLIVYVLALISTLVACGRLVMRFYEIKPVNISKFGGGKEIKENFSTTRISRKNYELGFAKRNIKRNFSKSITQIITVSLSYILCFVICNTFATVSGSDEKSLSDICDYSIKAESVNSDSFFTEEDVELVKSETAAKDVFTQKDISVDMDVNIDGNGAVVVIYSDELCRILAENIGEKYSANSDFAIFIGENCEQLTEVEYNDGSGKIALTNSYGTAISSLMSGMRSTGYTLIMNNKTADSIGCNTDKITTILVKTDKKIMEDDLRYIFDEATIFGLEDLNEGKEQSQQQLLGIVALAIYIVSATILLSFMIINNTIRENAVSRKREFGIMCSIGLKRSTLCKICCWENMILNAISCIIGVVVSLLINCYLTNILYDSFKLSLISYLAVAAVFTGVTAYFAYSFMKKYSDTPIVEMIRNE